MKSFLFSNILSFLGNLLSFKSYSINEREQFYSMETIDSSKTWMYELNEEQYNVHKFSYSMTKICLVEIQRNILFISQPLKEPNRQLTDKELHSKVSINETRMYNLSEANVGLLPNKMQRSKYWSKKTPIVLRNVLYLQNQSLVIPSGKTNQNHINVTLILFARTRRSKEEWFYRFVHASQLDLWRNEILYQIEQNQIIPNTKKINKIKISKRRRQNMITEHEEHQQRMMNFLKRSDRFTALDQLSYLKAVDTVYKFLPDFKQKKSDHNHQESFNNSQNKRSNEDVYLLSNPKQEYCERWLMEQNQMVETSTNDNFKISPFNRDMNTNRQQIEISRSSFFQNDTNHSLLYFVFKYLQQIPYNMTEDNLEDPVLLLNIFFARCFLDFFDNEKYLERIRIFLQKQFEKSRMPWIERILLTNLNLGDRLPEIKNIYKPWIDEHGFWSRMKISYNGKLHLTLNIKLKWIRKHLIDNNPLKTTRLSTSDKQLGKESKTILPKKSWRRRLWPPRRWFQRQQSLPKHSLISKTKPTKQITSSSSHITKITKTTLMIKLEVNNLHGILLFNIPSVPSDRLWISFLDMPTMEFSVLLQKNLFLFILIYRLS
ncbi:hypothetical protein I4U23_020882 [Adineta vaga]|nr:hypothetical protein I4U23_020882 [Adineta vaga]